MIFTDMTYNDLFLWGKNELLLSKNEDADFDAKELLYKACKITREEFIVNKNQNISENQYNLYLSYINRRKNGEPLQYILGEWEFYGLSFKVGKGVLIPRPETEMLVDIAINNLKNIDEPIVLDMCSGSGCIPISIAKNLPKSKVMGIEISDTAYQYFVKNIDLNCCGNVKPIYNDIFKWNDEKLYSKIDLITSNPPYINTDEIKFLQRELSFEPTLALDGGYDGLIFYRYITKIAIRYLKDQGMLAVEIGEKQGPEVRQLFLDNNFINVTIEKDFNNLDRVVKGIINKL